MIGLSILLIVLYFSHLFSYLLFFVIAGSYAVSRCSDVHDRREVLATAMYRLGTVSLPSLALLAVYLMQVDAPVGSVLLETWCI